MPVIITKFIKFSKKYGFKYTGSIINEYRGLNFLSFVNSFINRAAVNDKISPPNI